jgi:hypothetical protein
MKRVAAAVCVALAWCAAACDDRRIDMEKRHAVSADEYAWGPRCAEGVALGLFVPRRTFAPDTSVPWQWALRNLTESLVEVTIRHRDDPVFRTRLAVGRAGSPETLFEFSPPPPLTASSVAEKTVVLNEPTMLEGGEASIDRAWGPGEYDLQLTFGGPRFTFECRSGVVRIVVR